MIGNQKPENHIIIVYVISVERRDLLELSGIFGELLPEALGIIDHDKVSVCRRLRNQRDYIEIFENQNTFFKLLPNINYCMCATFHHKVIIRNEFYTCKHVLAAKLALLIGKIKISTLSHDAFSLSIQMIKPITTNLLEE